MKQEDLYFDGKTYEPKHDKARLTGQLLRVFSVMKDGSWRTLNQLSNLAGGSEAAVSARLRDLRKERFGSYTVERRRTSKPGLWEYRIKT